MQPITHSAIATINSSPAVLPATGFIREAQLIPRFIPVSSATWWRWCKSGKAPKGYKLSAGITAWRAEEIHDFLKTLAAGSVK